jgi:hypothetical protein
VGLGGVRKTALLRESGMPTLCKRRKGWATRGIADKWRTNEIMKEATKRSILRWIHIVFSIPILGYIYSPFEEIPKYAARVRFIVVPVMLLSGFWMWKGHVLRRPISRRSANKTTPMKTGQELEA